jgi:hypothetical protein
MRSSVGFDHAICGGAGSALSRINGNRAQGDDRVPQDDVNLGRNGVFTL